MNNAAKNQKKHEGAKSLSLAPLSFEEALDAFLHTPPMPKEPKPKKDGGKKDEKES